MWVETQPSTTQSSFQKLNVNNSCQKARKIRYYVLKYCPILLYYFTLCQIFCPILQNKEIIPWKVTQWEGKLLLSPTGAVETNCAKEIFVCLVAFYTKLIILPQDNSPLLLKVGNWCLLGTVFITFVASICSQENHLSLIMRTQILNLSQRHQPWCSLQEALANFHVFFLRKVDRKICSANIIRFLNIFNFFYL